MKKNYKKKEILFVLICTLFSGSIFAQLSLPQGSQKSIVSQRIGLTDIAITYSRPSVNNREIWGELVPYGMNNLGFGTAKESPWRAGANENTTISLSTDVSIQGKPLPSGIYGLHMILSEDDTAIVIFSKNYNAWGSYFYTPEDDALRVNVNIKEIPFKEQLTYEFNEVTDTSAITALSWEKKQIPFKIDVDVPTIVLANIREKLQGETGFVKESWVQAANYAFNNNGDLNEALKWVNNSISGQFYSKKEFNNLNLKAKILIKLGKLKESESIMKEAVLMGNVYELHNYGRQLIGQGQKEKALKIFKMNAKKNPNLWPVDYGLARGYSTVGEYKKALKHIKIAKSRAPDKLNKDNIIKLIKKLENKKDIN